MSDYLVFSDEAGIYDCQPNETFIRNHPFYIRSYVMISSSEYQEYQVELHKINRKYGIPYDEEIKWSDLGTKYKKGNPRTTVVSDISMESLSQYYKDVLEIADKKSIQYIFTVTDNRESYTQYDSEKIYKFHFQDAFQRVQMEINAKDLATFIMDELNEKLNRKIKAACHDFTEKGDYVQYTNLHHSIYTDNSAYSPGIQLADYAAGIMNSYIRRNLLSPNNYQFAVELFDEYINPKLRHSMQGVICGYGVIDVPKGEPLRTKLHNIFDATA